MPPRPPRACRPLLLFVVVVVVVCAKATIGQSVSQSVRPVELSSTSGGSLHSCDSAAPKCPSSPSANNVKWDGALGAAAAAPPPATNTTTIPPNPDRPTDRSINQSIDPPTTSTPEGPPQPASHGRAGPLD